MADGYRKPDTTAAHNAVLAAHQIAVTTSGDLHAASLDLSQVGCPPLSIFAAERVPSAAHDKQWISRAVAHLEPALARLDALREAVIAAQARVAELAEASTEETED